MESQRRVEAIVHGIVQGVFFRYNTRQQAEGLGVVGKVENLSDGTVRVVAEGTVERLDALIAWLQTGPEAAVVERVDVVWSDRIGGLAGFAILR